MMSEHLTGARGVTNGKHRAAPGICTTIVLAVLGIASQVVAQEAGFKIIVNSQNPTHTASRATVAGIFLKQVAEWPDGQPARPVDLVQGTSVREDFSAVVLGRSVPAVKSYWQKQIFSGSAVPPVERESEKEVIVFVGFNRGGVGYVSASTPLPGNVKVLKVTN